MNELKLVQLKRKISGKGLKGGVITILRAEVTLLANGPTGARCPLPKRYLERLGWKAGEDVFVTLTEDGKVIIEREKAMEKAS